jgi:hypothetical protein
VAQANVLERLHAPDYVVSYVLKDQGGYWLHSSANFLDETNSTAAQTPLRYAMPELWESLQKLCPDRHFPDCASDAERSRPMRSEEVQLGRGR